MRPDVKAKVAWFGGKMVEKLKANQHKGGWADLTSDQLLELLVAEVRELVDALNDGRGVVEECADVANFAMMIADREVDAHGRG